MNEFLQAVHAGAVDRVKRIVEENGHAILLTKTEDGRSAIHLATLNPNLEMVQYLLDLDNTCLDVQSANGNTPLHMACSWGYDDIVEFLVKRGANVNLRNANGETPLYKALAGDAVDEVVHFLLEEGGATIDIGNSFNERLVYLVTVRPNKAVLRFLLENASTVDNWSQPVLFWAIQHASCSGHTGPNDDDEVYKFLLKEKLANAEDVDGEGRTALHQAIHCMHMDHSTVDFLVKEECVNVEASDDDGRTPLHHASLRGKLRAVRVLLEDGHANVEARDGSGRTALHLCAKAGSCEVLEYLVNYGKANVNVVDDHGETPLHVACSPVGWTGGRHLDTVKFLAEIGGANVEAVDNMGRTALLRASKENYLKIVQNLVEAQSANLETADSDGWTALQLACHAGHLDLAVYLVGHIPATD
jgi:ankyrin repeat protein